MDVEVGLVEEVSRHAELVGVGADVAERGLRALFHHVAQLTGESQLALAGHLRGLHEENGPTYRRPGQTRRHTRIFGALGDLARELLRPEVRADVVLGAHDDGLGDRCLGHLDHHAANDGGDLPLERAHARLAGVLLDDQLEGLVGHQELRGRHPVLGELLGQQVSLRDVELLAPRVPGDLDDLHAVAQRRGDGVAHVGGGHEDHAR